MKKLSNLVPNLFQPLIKSIEPSPASKAGLLPGDFILKVNEIIYKFQ